MTRAQGKHREFSLNPFPAIDKYICTFLHCKPEHLTSLCNLPGCVHDHGKA